MTKRGKLLLTAMILSSPALTACGQDRPRIALPPAELASCSSEPAAPELPVQDWSSVEAAKAAQRMRDLAILNYVLLLRSWGGDCQAKVTGLKAWRDTAGR